MENESLSSRERELNMVAGFARLGREMQQEMLDRLRFGLTDFPDDSEIPDRIARYSLLKMFLNDAVGRELVAQGKTGLAREFRASQRKQFASRLAEFSDDALEAHRLYFGANVALSGATGGAKRNESWAYYQGAFASKLRIRQTIYELRAAFMFHRLRLSGGYYLAARACRRIPLCFPPGVRYPEIALA